MALHTLETVQHAAAAPRPMLPPGAPPKPSSASNSDSYAVFVAALLHDTGRRHTICASPTIRPPTPARQGIRWRGFRCPRWRRSLSGRLRPRGARDYAAHRRFPLVLLPQFVPSPVLGWLAEERRCCCRNWRYLCGERRDGALAELVAVGDRESVQRNLLAGPRQRFASARNVPLIERLMDALGRCWPMAPGYRSTATARSVGRRRRCLVGVEAPR
ncbi:MAG: TraI domain-containing protein [Betaproteobacteria bacterium]|nr:TraI domain-containing protein [Betaproteobacteria bacterium]